MERKKKVTCYCCVPQCNNREGKGLIFHHFPLDEKIRKCWVKALKLSKPPLRSTRVCSEHFEVSDYIPASELVRVRRLKKNVIPSKKIPDMQLFSGQRSLINEWCNSAQQNNKIVNCAVANCSSTTNVRSVGYKPYVYFFSFPKTKNIREDWIQRCCQRYRFDASLSNVCSIHFRAEDFFGNNKTRLCAGVVPTLNLPEECEQFKMRKGGDPLSLPTIRKEQNRYPHVIVKKEAATAVDSPWEVYIKTEEVETNIKQEPKEDIFVGLEMDVEEEENEPERVKHQRLFTARQPPPVIEKTLLKEVEVKEEIFADPLEIIEPLVRETTTFKSPISVRNIRNLT